MITNLMVFVFVVVWVGLWGVVWIGLWGQYWSNRIDAQREAAYQKMKKEREARMIRFASKHKTL